MDMKGKNKRRIHLIDKEFQTKFIVKFCLLVILSSIVTVSLLYFFALQTTTVSFEDARAVVKSTADFIFPVLLQTVIIVTVLVGIATIIITLLMSHKISGPLYRFRKEFEKIEAGDLVSGFNIRKNDQFKELADILNRAEKKLKDVLSKTKSNIRNLENTVNSLDIGDEKRSSLKKDIKDVEDSLDYFKT